MGHIFISYSHKDKEYVHRLQEAIQNDGFEVWIDDRIDYGTRWPKVIQEQLDSCSAFIVVVSENAFESEWVQNEVTRAKRKGKPFFPLLLSGDPWLSVETTQYVDVKDNSLPPQKFYDKLSKIIPRYKKKTPSAAVFIDGYWLYYACRRLNILDRLDYIELIKTFREHFGTQTPVYYFYALIPKHEEQQEHIKTLSNEGYDIELGTSMETLLRDGTKHVQVRGIDTLFVLRASTLPKETGTVILITGDGDFAPLIQHLQDIPKNIILITETPGSHVLRRVVKSGVIDLKRFIADLNAKRDPFQKVVVYESTPREHG